jgi:hypothetical protein
MPKIIDIGGQSTGLLGFGGSGNFGNIGGAVSDLFSYEASKYKVEGAQKEAAAYRQAGGLSLEQEEFERESTAIKEIQAQRTLYSATGATTAAVTGSGFELSGSALDVLRSGAQQGALQKQVLAQQGAINEASYQEQHDSYLLMAEAADASAKAANTSGLGALVGAGLKIAALL